MIGQFILQLLAALLALLAPASTHHGQTFRMEVQCLSVSNHHHGWRWICEQKSAFTR